VCLFKSIVVPAESTGKTNGDGRASEEKKDDTAVVVTSSTPFSSWYDQLGHEPHVYEASASAYRGVVLEGKDQTILVSGESGAGKTETIKIVLKHLATIDVTAMSSDEVAPEDRAWIRNIVESSPLFEAFGNAKTFTNHNSTRFGMVTRLHFQFQNNGICRLEGSTCDTYLLETSRVVTHAPDERNFHIFYQLMAMSPEDKSRLLGEEWKDAVVADFRYLNDIGDHEMKHISDYEMAQQTLATLELFQWSGLYLETLMKALGTILRLGNISFVEWEDGIAAISSPEELDKLAVSFGIDAKVIEKALTTRSFQNNQETLSVPQNAELAREACDALAKKMYARVFDSVVRAVNVQTGSVEANQEYGVISLVDIFGFEQFEVNRFEQLCVNYASEKVQQKYVVDILRKMKTEYTMEGISVMDFKEFDNSGIIDLIEGTHGIISALNEECVRLDGSSEVSETIVTEWQECGLLVQNLSSYVSLQAFVSRIRHGCKDNEYFMHGALQKTTEFGVRHFAGPVIYDASRFVEQNTDKLPEGLLRLSMKSSNPFIAAEFGELLREHELIDTSNDVKRKSKMNMTVFDKFRFQLRDLMKTMRNSQTRYIRCIKPNDTLQPEIVDHQTAMRQLECAGLVTAIELSRETFPNKLSHRAVEERFRCLLTRRQSNNMQDMQQDEKAQYMMSLLFSTDIKKNRVGDFTMPFACGRTKVYYRAGALEMLEARRHSHYSSAANQIQRWIRRRRQDRERCVLKAKESATKIAAFYRSHSASRCFDELRYSVVVIQAAMRGSAARKSYAKRLHAAYVIVDICCAFLEERKRLRDFKAASTIASWYHRNYILQEAQKNKSVIIVQSTLRGFLARERCKKKLNSFDDKSCDDSLSLSFLDDMEEEEVASIIAAWYRGRQGLKRYRQTKNAATRLQAMVRGKIDRDQFLIMKGATLAIELWWCNMKVKPITLVEPEQDELARVEEDESAATLQAWIRRRNLEHTYQKKRRATLASQESRRSLLSAKEDIRQSSQRDIHANNSQRRLMLSESKKNGCSFREKLGTILKLQEKDNHGVQDEAVVEDKTISDEDSVFAGTSVAGEAQPMLVMKLRKDVEHYKQEVEMLREEMQHITAEAELHAQEVEAEFEEKLYLYEDEVLQLKLEIEKLVEERSLLEEEMVEAEKKHKKSIAILQKGIQKTQESHRDYLDKIMGVLDDTEATRKLETDRIREELEAVKHDRDTKISALKEEIKLLRNSGSGSKKKRSGSAAQRAQMLSQKLLAALSPDNLLLVAKEAQQAGSAQRYIEENLSVKARRMISHLEQMASLVDEENVNGEQGKDADQVRSLKEQLHRAYEEIGRLEDEIRGEFE